MPRVTADLRHQFLRGPLSQKGYGKLRRVQKTAKGKRGYIELKEDGHINTNGFHVRTFNRPPTSALALRNYPQLGIGVGTMLRGMLRLFMPLIKKTGKRLVRAGVSKGGESLKDIVRDAAKEAAKVGGKQVLKTGGKVLVKSAANVAQDVLSGKKVSEVLKNEVMNIKDKIDDDISNLQGAEVKGDTPLVGSAHEKPKKRKNPVKVKRKDITVKTKKKSLLDRLSDPL